MGALAFTVAFEGIEARIVEVQSAVTPGLPGFSLVGLPDKAVSEARERVKAALQSMAIALPSKRITVNLSPADLPKEGSHFDLPIALSVLAALDILPKEEVETTVALGELSLDGRIVPVIGALPAAMAAAEAGKDPALPRAPAGPRPPGSAQPRFWPRVRWKRSCAISPARCTSPRPRRARCPQAPPGATCAR